MAKRDYQFADGKRLRLGEKTCIMGILNVTEDSFSDGGQYADIDRAKAHLQQLVADGADIIDIGAESTRPGATPLSSEEELRRLLPFLEALLPVCPVPLSVDTYHAATAQAVLERGVNIINDVGGLSYRGETLDKMAATAAKFNAPLIVTHGGDISSVGHNTGEGLTISLQFFFEEAKKIAVDNGLANENLLFDPGLGFTDKNTSQNLLVVSNLRYLKYLHGEELPLVVGASRKRFIGEVLNLPVGERTEGTAAICAVAALFGCEIVRVHDALPISRVCKMIDAVRYPYAYAEEKYGFFGN